VGPDRESLEAAYRATAYWVEAPAGRFALRVGVRCTDLDRLLAAHGVEAWAYVTAYNPGSWPLPEAENRARQDELCRAVAAAGYAAYAGEGVGAGWPPEASLLVLGIGEEDAAALGRRFGQAAVVVGRSGGPARLLWLGG
jgi:hypothetical protein